MSDADREAYAYFRGNVTAVARARDAVVAGGDRAAAVPVPQFLIDGWAQSQPVALRTLQRAFAEQLTPGERAYWTIGDQQQAVIDAARYRNGLTIAEADALLTAHALGNTPDYGGWRREHLDTEHHLKTAGLLRSVNGPHHAELHPDVVFSLSRHE